MSKDLVSDALNTIKTHEMNGKEECEVKYSKLIKEILKILQQKNYIGEFEFVDKGPHSYFKVKLLGKINNCGAIKPRFAIKKTEWVEWEQKYIPGLGFGFLIVSTPKGLMTNEEAKKQNLGGRLIAFVY
ncbi:MAG: 30S ribosomal protein S8 [Candidatus Micrarchaeota archaeon]|nr:30S ribosomal protein S8 [Candidatus Micrarchaeota archaeon]